MTNDDAPTRTEIRATLEHFGHVPADQVPKWLRITSTVIPLDIHDFCLAFVLGLYRLDCRGYATDVKAVFHNDRLVEWQNVDNPYGLFELMEEEYLTLEN